MSTVCACVHIQITYYWQLPLGLPYAIVSNTKVNHFAVLTTSGKVHCFRIKLTFKPDPSVVSFLPGLALIKTTVLESMRTLSHFRLNTLSFSVY